MGNVRLSLVLVLAAACGSSNGGKQVDAQIKVPDAPPDAKMWMDAPPPMYDFSCAGNTAPTTALDPVNVSGTVTELGVSGMAPTFTMLANATVDACKGNCTGPNRLATATTDANGAFTDANVATGGAPLDGYAKMTPPAGNTDRVIFAYPPVPLVKDFTSVPVLTFTPQALVGLSILGYSQMANKGMVAIIVTDCAGTRITDSANITLSINGTTPAKSDTLDAGALNMMGAGLFVVFNVAPGATTTVGAKYMSMTLLAHTVAVTAGTTTETQVRPGY